MPATYFDDGVCGKDGWVYDTNYHVARTDLIPRHVTLRTPGDSSVDATLYAAHRIMRRLTEGNAPLDARLEGYHEVQSVRNCYEICKHLQLSGLGCAFFSVSTVEAPYYCFLHKSCSTNLGQTNNGVLVTEAQSTGDGDPTAP
jgi:hypothetical protein